MSSVGPLVVDVEVHGVQLVGRERARVLDRPGRGQVDAVDEQDHDVAAQHLGLAGLDGRTLFEDGVLGAVLAVRRTRPKTRSGITTTTTQAPWVNSVTTKTTTTTAQTTAAMPLTTTRWRQCWSRWVKWCFAMPAPAIVKPVKTPIAYIGMSDATLAPVASSRAMDAPARRRMPFEKTSRWPADGELAGQERVLGDEADQEGEAGVARVGGEDEDQGGGGLQRVVEDLPGGREP